MVEKEVLHSAASSALAASRACFLLMPTRALQAVSFRSAPSARFIWYLCRVDGVDARSLIKDAGVARVRASSALRAQLATDGQNEAANVGLGRRWGTCFH